VVVEGEAVRGRRPSAAGVVRFAHQVGVMELEAWMSMRNRGLAPSSRLRMDFDAVIATL
jgi:hypothetical protein